MDDNFLQSEMWRKFQESVGRRTFFVKDDKDVKSQGDYVPSLSADIIEHKLPIVGKYFYVPRGPIVSGGSEKCFDKIINLAKENNVGWIRIDPENEKILELAKELKIEKAPHDMQPKEIFVMDISKIEEDLLLEMKEKTRYNIKLAQKKGVKIILADKNHLEEFFKLINQTSNRKGIKSHTESYYKKMMEMIPQENLKLYLAEYQNKIISGILVIYFGKTAIYLHGASSDEFRNVMAPYLLQWQAIQDAKKGGMEKYDFGGIKTVNSEQGSGNNNSWAGITKFKMGFSPNTKPVEFPGSYDIIINPLRYKIYRFIQGIRAKL